MLDLIRRYGVIVDWGSGELLARTTEQFRAMLQQRMAAYWDSDAATPGTAPTLKVA
jgi:N-methylhydantoinase B